MFSSGFSSNKKVVLFNHFKNEMLQNLKIFLVSVLCAVCNQHEFLIYVLRI